MPNRGNLRKQKMWIKDENSKRCGFSAKQEANNSCVDEGNRSSIFYCSRNAYLVCDLGIKIHIGFRCRDANDQGVSC